MESGMGSSYGVWDFYEYYSGNGNFMEATWAQGSFSHSNWDEPDFNDFDGISNELGRLWYDGRAGDYTGCFTGYFGGRFPCGLALQLLEA